MSATAPMHPGGLDVTRQGLAACSWAPGAKVADVGCGVGETLRLLRESGFSACGTELCAEKVREAAARSGCAVEQADASALPYADVALDGLVCECVLSLLSNPGKALAEFRRVLRPGGGLLLSDVSAVAEDSIPEELHRHGFAVTRVLEHAAALKAYAAQLVWQGADTGFPGSGGRLTYRQWIAVKSVEDAP